MPAQMIDNSSLLSRGLLDTSKVFHKDFEAVEEDGWRLLQSFFSCPHPIVSQLSLHPTTSEPAVILDPARLDILTPQGLRVKTVDSIWRLGDLRLPLARRLSLPVHCHFVHPITGIPVSETLTVGEYVKKSGPRIRLQIRLIQKAKTLMLKGEEPVEMMRQPLSFTFGAIPEGMVEEGSTPTGAPKPIGLVNRGNACYLNAALQCLCRIPELSGYMLSPEGAAQINAGIRGGASGIIAKEYRRFLELVGGVNGCAKDPVALRMAIGTRYPQFNNAEQHDAQELLCALLDGLHEDLARRNEPNDGLTPRSRNARARPTRPPSIIGDLFFGSLITTLLCPVCLNRESGYDSFVCLSLALPTSPDELSLEGCLRYFTSEETLEPTDMWLCPTCKDRVCAKKTTIIHKPPKILILHLKRFTAANKAHKKVALAVDYPLELDISRFSETPAPKYRLIGVVMHSGTLSLGHYTAAAIDPTTDQWHLFNDCYVSPTSEQCVKSRRAYVLLYQAMNEPGSPT
jgi:ubiquitin C-terminal hydrolase